MRGLALFLGVLFFSQRAIAGDPTSSNISLTVQSLRTYCAACHAVGTELRFLQSDSDEEVWNSLFAEKAPSGRVWAQEIVRVLSWPSDSPPSFDRMMDPPDHDWMPKGYARIQFSQAQENGTYLRRRILSNLESALATLTESDSP